MEILRNFFLFSAVLFLIFSVTSCKQENYYRLTTEAKNLLEFETGESFTIKNISTDEAITLIVSAKNFQYVKWDSTSSSMISFGFPTADEYVQQGKYTFSDADGCFGQITVQMIDQNEYAATIEVSGCFGQRTFYLGSKLETDQFNLGQTDYYLFSDEYSLLFFKPGVGILLIMDYYGTQEYLLVE